MAYNLHAGQKFNRLTVIERSYTNSHGERVWKCQCECGSITYVPSYALVHGDTKSCGCLVNDRIREVCITHGETKTRLYRTYTNMLTRCYNPNYKFFHAYGGRGIKVCDEWLGANGFINFSNWAKDNGFSETLTIDRINVDGDYCPQNCKWSTMKEQQNNRTNNVHYDYNGETKTLAQWADTLGVKYSKLQYWLRTRRVSMDEAVKKLCG